MGVHEPGRQVEALAVDPPQPGRRVAPDPGHPPLDHRHVRDPSRTPEPVEHGPAPEQHAGAAHGSGPVATGREGSATQSLQEPAYSDAGMPATSQARTTWAATTPEPQ
jgi:hypothetical protein